MGCGSSAPTTPDNLSLHEQNEDAHPHDHTHHHDNTHHRDTDDNRHDNRDDPAPDPHEEDRNISNDVTDKDPTPTDHRNNRHKPDPRNDDDGSGLKYQTVDYRTVKGPEYHDSAPSVRGLWVDDEFPPNVAIEEFRRNNLEWKRPTELRQNPVLFSEGTTRFDIGQGSAGTCWFLSMLANLSENPQLLAKVVSNGDYNPDTGVFHCKFWKFGVWEDVYIDDNLPVIYGRQIWGARSATDDDEMWVSLLEKAFAKLHGSYNSIYGGQSSDAYLALTGGLAERVDFDDKDVVPDQLFRRVRNAVHTGAMVTCTVPDQFDGKHGLVGGHAYSLTGAEVAHRNDGDSEQLFRVRNPWGNTEWTGRWSDGSKEWHSIPEGSIRKVNIDDGEFWISMEDFLTYFSQTTICSLTPDFDMDGCSDSLNHVLRIYGQWLGETAAGFREKLQNPRFHFTIPDDGMSEDGLVPMVVQLVQKTQHRKADKISIRCDIYKVLGSQRGRHPKFVLELMGEETNVFSPAIQCSFRHKVEPGHYVVVPSAIEPNLEKEFLIRIFAPCRLYECSEIPRDAILMSCDSETSMEVNGSTVKLTTSETLFGAWKAGYNAGGQISKRETHHCNPQYEFTVPDRGMPIPVIFHLLQSHEGNQFPVGLRVYPLTRHPPVDIDYLYDNYDSCPEPAEGGTFVITWDLDVKYVMPPGRYMVLLHTDEADTEKEFVLHIRSSAHLDIKGYQTGE